MRVEEKAETLEIIADRIAYKYLDRTIGSGKLKSDILSALEDERERCAKVAEDHYEHAVECEGGQACSLNIAAAIREGR